MASIRRSLLFSFAEKYSSLIVNIIAVTVLARLLSPAEIGVFSVGAAVLTLAHVLRDFGVGNYLIQEPDLTREKIAAAFGLSLVIAWTVAAALFLLRDPIAAFYGEPGLRDVVAVMAVNFLVIPISSPAIALLNRDMAFHLLYRVGLAGAIGNAATGITLAALGFGFMSLAWASLAGVVATAVAASLVRPRATWLIPRFAGWRTVARFGGIASANSLLGQLGMMAPDLILGRLLGFSAVGFYSRARGLITLFDQSVTQAVAPVALAAFARDRRSGGDLKPAYLKGLACLTAVAWPFFLFAAVMAFPIVRLLFGDQWDPAVPLVRILCVAAAGRMMFQFVGQVLIAMGAVGDLLRVNLIVQPLRIALIFAAAPFGLEAVTATTIVAVVLNVALFQRHLKRLIGVGYRDIARHTARSAAVTLVAGTALGAFLMFAPSQPPMSWVILLGAGAVFSLAWLGAMVAVGHPLADEARVLTASLRTRLRDRRSRPV